MDTVTDARMSIALALEGGIGIIHKNMTITQQVDEVRKVKRYQSGMIEDPLHIRSTATSGEALRLMKKFGIGGIPVVDAQNTLMGIITKRDLRFEKNLRGKVDKIMTKSPVTLHQNDDPARAIDMLKRHKIEKLPIVDNENKLKGLITYKDILKSENSPNACQDPHGRLRVGAAIGVGDEQQSRAEELIRAKVDLLCIDTAHAHSKGVMDMVKWLRKHFPATEIMVGNIATAEAARQLAELGIQAVKVGVGPGSICTTRVIAGVGMPQLSAIMEVAEALEGTDVRVVADGGIRFSGDIVKALVGGAHVVMIGSLLAGTEEAPGNVILLQGKKYKTYRGMGSIEAMQAGAKDRYFQEHTEEIDKLVPEGIMGRVPYRGFASEVLYQLVGGLRAGMGYCGTATLSALREAQFVRITAASNLEGHPHDVTITQGAPNYFSL